MKPRVCIAVAGIVVIVAACTAVRSEECSINDDCWEGLVCVDNPVVCTAEPCNHPAATCERQCDDASPCGPRDYCSVNTFKVRSASDSVPVHICIPPRRDAGTQ